MREIELLPLSEDESREMLHSLLGPDQPVPGIAAKRALMHAAAGHPMVLELLVRDWTKSGEQSLALSLDAMTAELENEGCLRAAYVQILDRITRSLDRTTQNVLNLAALLGHRLNDLGLYGVVDLSPGQTMSSLTELVNRRVLRDSARGLEFVNELVRAAAYLRVPLTVRRVLHQHIAERLIAQQAEGDDGLGLEIAWHSIRAGQPERATNFLLDGARESLRKGAVHGAERALSTAMPHLGQSERHEATLLLAETLQEQGRWIESATVLDQAPSTEASELASVLALVATFKSANPSDEDAIRNIAELQNIIKVSSDLHVRVRAAEAAALMATHLRSVQYAKQVLACINQIPAPLLSLSDWTCLAESKARLLYYAAERRASFNEVARIVEQLQDGRQVNSTVGRLHTGLGVLACCQGNYSEGRTAFRMAYDVYVRLGNDLGRGAAAAQLALSSFRIGEYAEAVDWGLTAVSSFGEQFAGFAECQAAQFIGCSYAMQGEHRKAQEAIARLEARISTTLPPWAYQGWLLAKADILYLLGNIPAAIHLARFAIGEPSPVLYSNDFAGIFARWLSLASIGTETEAQARDGIRRMALNLETLDALDQVEVLCASRLIQEAESLGLAGLIDMKLKCLPEAVSQQLGRLGVLSMPVVSRDPVSAN
jgi:tetratricopeptide (TPR) repeat protein